jgi:hypothetical protein
MRLYTLVLSIKLMFIIIHINNIMENKCMRIVHAVHTPQLFHFIIYMFAAPDKTTRSSQVFLEDILAEFVTSHGRSIRMHLRGLVLSNVKCSFKNKINQSGPNSVQHDAQ